MQQVACFTLSNGLRSVFLYNNSPVTYCALSTRAGTRYEPAALPGLAHLGEHMLFKGTQKRRPYHINNRLERLGGELNAFTTKEEMVVQATVLKEDLGAALDLIADLVFHSQVPEKELIKEKEVVADEIRSYKDLPNERIYDEFETALLKGSPLSVGILGTQRSLAKMQREDLLTFYENRFRPEQMVLSVVGKYPLERVKYWAEKYFGTAAPLPETTAPQQDPGDAHRIPYAPFRTERKHGTHQVHCLVGAPAPNIYSPKRTATSLLMNILGGPAGNALLNLSLREKYGLVYTVEASFSPYSDAGWAGIYFGTDKPKLDKCLHIIHETLDRMACLPLSDMKMEQAKKQFRGQIAIASDNAEAQCLSMGKNMLTFGRILSDEEITAQINKLQPADIVEAAAAMNEASRSILIYD